MCGFHVYRVVCEFHVYVWCATDVNQMVTGVNWNGRRKARLTIQGAFILHSFTVAILFCNLEIRNPERDEEKDH